MVAPINPLKGKSSYGWHFEQNVYDPNGIVRTVKAGGGSGNIPKVILGGNMEKLRIRKLTPKECWRLMGWTDEYFNKISGISNTQLYKMAGNSIVVQVLEAIFRNMFLEEQQKAQIDIFDFIDVSNSK